MCGLLLNYTYLRLADYYLLLGDYKLEQACLTNYRVTVTILSPKLQVRTGFRGSCLHF